MCGSVAYLAGCAELVEGSQQSFFRHVDLMASNAIQRIKGVRGGKSGSPTQNTADHESVVPALSYAAVTNP